MYYLVNFDISYILDDSLPTDVTKLSGKALSYKYHVTPATSDRNQIVPTSLRRGLGRNRSLSRTSAVPGLGKAPAPMLLKLSINIYFIRIKQVTLHVIRH